MPHPRPPHLITLLEAESEADRRRAWTALVEQHTRLLLHVCRAMGGDQDEAMDRFTHVLEALREDDYRRLRRFREDGRGSFSTWLVVVVRRLCLDRERTLYGREREGESEDTRDGRENRRRFARFVGDALDLEGFPSRWPGPECQLREKELLEKLAAAVSRLDDRDRLLLRLRFEKDLSAARIAGMMDYPTPFHVYRRLNKLLAELRGLLESAGIAGVEP